MAKPDFDADTVQGALLYFATRLSELEPHGWHFDRSYVQTTPEVWGLAVKFVNGDDDRWAVYVLKSCRGKGYLSHFISRRPHMKIITFDDCDVADFYRRHGRDVLVLRSVR